MLSDRFWGFSDKSCMAKVEGHTEDPDTVEVSPEAHRYLSNRYADTREIVVSKGNEIASLGGVSVTLAPQEGVRGARIPVVEYLLEPDDSRGGYKLPDSVSLTFNLGGVTPNDDVLGYSMDELPAAMQELADDILDPRYR